MGGAKLTLKWWWTLQIVYTISTLFFSLSYKIPILFQLAMCPSKRLLSLPCSYGRQMKGSGSYYVGPPAKLLKAETVSICPFYLLPTSFWKLDMMAGAPAAILDHMQPRGWKPCTKNGKAERLYLDCLPQISFKNLIENKLLVV